MLLGDCIYLIKYCKYIYKKYSSWLQSCFFFSSHYSIITSSSEVPPPPEVFDYKLHFMHNRYQITWHLFLGFAVSISTSAHSHKKDASSSPAVERKADSLSTTLNHTYCRQQVEMFSSTVLSLWFIMRTSSYLISTCRRLY